MAFFQSTYRFEVFLDFSQNLFPQCSFSVLWVLYFLPNFDPGINLLAQFFAEILSHFKAKKVTDLS